MKLFSNLDTEDKILFAVYAIGLAGWSFIISWYALEVLEKL